MKGALASASGKKAALAGGAIEWKAGEAGAWIEHRGARLSLPAKAEVRWPVLPHNPYRKDGAAEPEEGRIVVDAPARGSFTLDVK
jgi:hypothetical protein